MTIRQKTQTVIEWCGIVLLLLTAAAVGAAFVGYLKDGAPIVSRAHAHSFYDAECCNGIDCAPVEKAESSVLVIAGALLPSILTVTTMHGTADVPPDMTPRPSPDGRMHACLRRGSDGTMRVICIYIPPTM